MSPLELKVCNAKEKGGEWPLNDSQETPPRTLKAVELVVFPVGDAVYTLRAQAPEPNFQWLSSWLYPLRVG